MQYHIILIVRSHTHRTQVTNQVWHTYNIAAALYEGGVHFYKFMNAYACTMTKTQCTDEYLLVRNGVSYNCTLPRFLSVNNGRRLHLSRRMHVFILLFFTFLKRWWRSLLNLCILKPFCLFAMVFWFSLSFFSWCQQQPKSIRALICIFS